MTTTTIAFYGLGAMGRPMARRLIEAQYRVQGFDVSVDALSALKAMGGEPCASPAEAAAGADVALVMVVNADQAEAVLFGDAGAAEALAPASLVILSPTMAPARAKAIGDRLAAMGLAALDAPVSGGVAGAETGALSIMAAGPDAAFAHAKPVLDVLGGNVFHVGPEIGQGAAVKVINQLLCGVHIVAAAEAHALAESAGLDTAKLAEVIHVSAGMSWMFGDRGPRMRVDDPPVRSAVEIFVKDLGLVLDMGHGVKAATPLAALSHQMFLAASGAGLGHADDSQVVDVYRRMTDRARRR